MIYPAITLLFVIAVLILFSRTIFFLTTNINKAFSDSSAALRESAPQFDMANYELIRKRFGWPELSRSSSTEPATTPKIEEKNSAASTQKTLEKPAAPSDSPQTISEKKSIVIKIFNGPGGTVGAESLQESLAQENFTNTSIDSHQLVLKNTIVQYKTSNKKLLNYASEIKKIISDKYDSQMGSDLPEDAEYDVSILIGKK